MSPEQQPIHPFWKSEAFKQILLRVQQRAQRKQQPDIPKTTEEVLQMADDYLEQFFKNKNHGRQNEEDPAMD